MFCITEEKTALPTPDEAGQYIAVARIVKAQGRRGEVAAEVMTDFPARFENQRRVYLASASGRPEAVTVSGARLHKGRMIFKFSGVDSIESAERLRGRLILIERKERVSLPEHHYYVWELEGCRVVRRSGTTTKEVGTVTEVERTGGVDLLRVTPSDGRQGELLIPLAQAICTTIDTAAKTIWIDPPGDLLNLNQQARAARRPR